MAPAKRTADETTTMRAALLEHAARLVRREGAKALTMRGLAREAGCALGLPYKFFGGRDELVAALVDDRFDQLAVMLDEVVASAGTGTVAGNLARFAEVLLDSGPEVLQLAHGLDPALTGQVEASARRSGFLGGLETTVARYVAAEKAMGRVAEAVDEDAIGFLVTGAIHNLLVSGPAYPRPDAEELRRVLASLAHLLA